jgi:DNA-binding NtrC family response regulator
MEDKNMRLIKNEPIGQDDITPLREKFVNEYSKRKGWNAKELSTSQMLEIVSQKEYKGLILG